MGGGGSLWNVLIPAYMSSVLNTTHFAHNLFNLRGKFFGHDVVLEVEGIVGSVSKLSGLRARHHSMFGWLRDALAELTEHFFLLL